MREDHRPRTSPPPAGRAQRGTARVPPRRIPTSPGRPRPTAAAVGGDTRSRRDAIPHAGSTLVTPPPLAPTIAACSRTRHICSGIQRCTRRPSAPPWPRSRLVVVVSRAGRRNRPSGAPRKSEAEKDSLCRCLQSRTRCQNPLQRRQRGGS
jgi:hypothetical protein